MSNRLFTDIAFRKLNYSGERICGDSFLSRTYSNGRRTIAVHSDGMGHGVKANILSTFTSSMLLNFTASDNDIKSTAAMILRMLPVCSIRKISYSTFSVVDINNVTGEVSIAEHDTPTAILLRDGLPDDLEWENFEVDRGPGERPLRLRTAGFTAKAGDRLILTSDGVVQSGQRTQLYKFGWGEAQLRQFVSYMVSVNEGISSADIASQVVSKSNINDGNQPSDDMSCAAIHFRAPKRMLLVSCPPMLKEDNAALVADVASFGGTKVICGHPVAQIIAAGMGLRLEKTHAQADPLDAAQFRLPSFDLVTEGVMVPARVLDILEHHPEEAATNGVADKLFRMLIRHDEIEFAIGTKKSPDSDKKFIDEFELRRNVLRRIIKLLQHKFNKHITVKYY